MVTHEQRKNLSANQQNNKGLGHARGRSTSTVHFPRTVHRLPCPSIATMRTAIVSSLLCLGARAFAPSHPSAPRRATIVSSTAVASEASPAASSSSSNTNKNDPTWEVKQHLYGLDMINEAESSGMSVTLNAEGEVEGGEALPLPQTYITCGKCKSLFAISEADLGDRGKGW